MQDLNKLTVPELRKLAKELTDDSVSKLRKAELIDVIEKSRALTDLDNQATAYITDGELQDFVGSALSAASGIGQLGGAMQAFGTVLHEQFETFTAAERQELNEAKYRGRYEGKPAVVQMRKHVIEGTVTDRVHRGSELLLVLRHAEDAGHPRVTLHRAVDVLV
jgi:hypothetical protein